MKGRVLFITLCFLMASIVNSNAVRYAVKFNEEGKIISSQPLSDKYVQKFKGDSSNPLNQGYVLVDDISIYQEVKSIPETEKEKILRILGLEEKHINKIKGLE